MSNRDLDTPPPDGDPAPRRWSTGHTVAAAVVAVGVLASGGVAWAARDSTGATTGPGGVRQQPGQLPGPGQFGVPPPQPPGQLTQDDGGVHT